MALQICLRMVVLPVRGGATMKEFKNEAGVFTLTPPDGHTLDDQTKGRKE